MSRLMVLFLAILLFFSTNIFAEKKELSKDQAIDIATEAIKKEGLNLEGIEVIYDEGNRLWEAQISKITALDKGSSFAVLKKGFLNNYRIVYCHFNTPPQDVWVFIDKDTGEVLEVYKT